VTAARLPDFFVAGAPKAGTTALHVALARHPQVFMSRVKEPKHFLTDGPPPARGGPGDAKTFAEYVWRRDEYERLFAEAAPDQLVGESTPFYLYDAASHRRIREAVPDARLIALLRDPVDRAHSNWTHLWSAGLEAESDVVRACRLEERRAAAGWAPFWRYLGLGRYGEQLARLYETFPREQVLVLRYRDLREQPAEALALIVDFLDLEPGRVSEVPAENVTAHASGTFGNRAVSAALRAGDRVERVLPNRLWTPARAAMSRRLQREQRPRQPLTDQQREQLVPLVADDVRLLEQVTGQSFGDWLEPRVSRARRALDPGGKIGTAHNSIDRPLDPAEQRAARDRRRRVS
jgi:hypothetical protein